MRKICSSNGLWKCWLFEYKNNIYLVNFKNNKIIKMDKSIYSDIDNLSLIDIKSIDWLIYEGVIEEEDYSPIKHGSYYPTVGTFLLSTVCNLNCTYCYAYNNDAMNLDFESARVAVDFLIENTLNRQLREMTIKYHGAGEPTLNFEVLRKIHGYAQERAEESGINVKYNLTTNGVIENDKRAWLAANIDTITLSFDGFDYIQNIQRPHNSLNSYKEVIDTLDYFVTNGKSIGVRTTITNENVDIMRDWVGFLQREGIRHVNFEPVSICGACEITNICDVSGDEFCNNYMLAERYGRTIGIDVTYSGIKFGKVINYHCGGYGTNFVITPDASISTCYEVFHRKGTLADYFIIGQVKNGEISIVNSKLKYLRELTYQKLNDCKDCFAFFQCGGGCISRRVLCENAKTRDSVTNKCNVTKALLTKKLEDYIEQHITNSGLVYYFGFKR